jgi:hypothetical protein
MNCVERSGQGPFRRMAWIERSNQRSHEPRAQGAPQFSRRRGEARPRPPTRGNHRGVLAADSPPQSALRLAEAVPISIRRTVGRRSNWPAV